MCHNVVDGRYHSLCGHFYAMATQKQDCLRTNCVFSERHTPGCTSMTCNRMMAPPARNPIRLSQTVCAECNLRSRGKVGPKGGSIAVQGR